MKILFNLASRSRPQKLKETIENIINHCEGFSYWILVSIDVDDPTLPEMQKHGFFHPSFVRVSLGKSKNKVDAINRFSEYSGEWDIVVNTSDDMRFTVLGFDNIIRANMPADLDAFLHFPDGFAAERLPTMSIMGKAYFDRFGYIYHPDYISLWCDNEAMEVAQKLGKYKFVNERIFEHFHPANGNAKTDAQYRKTESFYRIDEKTFKKRKAMNFYLPR